MEFGPHLILATLEGAVTAAVLALTAVGLSLVFGVMRVVNIAHGEFYMLGAVIAWYVAQMVGGHPALGFVAALVIAPLVVGMLAAAADVTILKRIEYDPERTIVATIGLLYIIQQLTLMTYGPEARPVEAPFNTRVELPWFDWFETLFGMAQPWGWSITSYKLFVIFAAGAVLCGVWAMMARTKIGLLMRATQADRDMALAFGIPVERVYALVFGIGAGLAALGAVLIVPIQQAHYLMGVEPLLLAFIVVIIGGLGSFWGTLAGGVILGVAQTTGAQISPEWQTLAGHVVFLIVLIVRPRGLFPRHVD